MTVITKTDIENIQNMREFPFTVNTSVIISDYMVFKNNINMADMSRDQELEMCTTFKHICYYTYLMTGFAALYTYFKNSEKGDELFGPDSGMSFDEFCDFIRSTFFDKPFSSIQEYHELLSGGEINPLNVEWSFIRYLGQPLCDQIYDDIRGIDYFVGALFDAEKATEGKFIDKLEEAFCNKHLHNLIAQAACDALFAKKLKIAHVVNENGKHDWGLTIPNEIVDSEPFFEDIREAPVVIIEDTDIASAKEFMDKYTLPQVCEEFADVILDNLFEMDCREMALKYVNLLHIKLDVDTDSVREFADSNKYKDKWVEFEGSVFNQV